MKTSRAFLTKYLLRAVACLVLGMIVSTNSLHAASGGLVELPISPTGAMLYSKKSGLDLRLDTSWAGAYGYRPVSCVLTAKSPQTADRQIKIRFLAGIWRSDRPTMIVEKNFELPAGSLSAKTVISVPQYLEWRMIGCETYIDDEKDDELSVPQFPFVSTQTGNNFTALLWDNVSHVPFRLFRDIRGGPAEVFSMPLEMHRDKWTDYSSMDAVVTTVADIKVAKAENPKRLAEILKWVRSGGNLWVFSATGEYEYIPELENLIGLQDSPSEVVVDAEELLERGWRFPRLDNPASDALEKYNQLFTPAPREELNEEEEQELPDDSREWFATRPLSMGTVTAFSVSPNMSRRDARDLTWAITQSLLADRLSWKDRHGTDPNRGNDNFNDFLIPDVGAAPVTAFQILLSLFVLTIGPLNYFLLKSREKLPLLLLTVPTAALVTTLFLLIYSFVSEGFGTLVRVRSFTYLDQKANSSVCWSRLSYFAGVAPSDGLGFSNDVLVYPILPSVRQNDRREFRRYSGQQREIVWDENQELRQGWLTSRTPTQYLTITSRPSEQELEIVTNKKSLSARNKLRAGIHTLVLEDYEGNVYITENLAQGKVVELTPTTQVKAMLKLRTLLAKNEPQFPAGTIESLSLGGGIDLLPFSQNLMETQISAITSAVSQGWGPGSFIAVTDRGIDVALGLDDAVENSSFHVVRGVW